MKNRVRESFLPNRFTLFAAACGLLACLPAAHAAQISARPLTPQEIHDNHLPEGTVPSGGLTNVGVGEPIYLEVLVDKGTVVSNVQWSVAPVDYYIFPAPNSMADIEPSPIPAEMPIYSPGDREVYDAFGRVMFVPDAVGAYRVQAIVTIGGSSETIQTDVFGAKYVGVGTMGGATPKWPECGACHEERATEFMGTGHATFLELAIDGLKSSHYSENCIDCHALGATVPDAPNGGFYDAAAKAGWTFPTVLQPGNWDAMPQSVKAKANIQCEHCHGAGSMHIGNPESIAVSLSSGDCGQCHDEEPYHSKNKEWNISGHAVATRYPTGEGRSSCVRCHSGIGFIDYVDGIPASETDTAYEAIVCAACHEPHHGDNPGQLRTVADVTFRNGEVATEGGTGKLCINCHQSRQDGEVYAVTASVNSRFGPHYGTQGDVFYGTNAVEYGKNIPSSMHYRAVDNGCASCHMQSIGMKDPAFNEVGGHTFKMTWDNNGEEVDMVAVCQDCHGDMDSFDLVRSDYNLDGKTEGVQTEVHHLLDTLAMMLPPLGSTTVTPASSYTMAQRKALYNYKTVEEDRSFGIHNTRYTVGILKASITDLGDPFNAFLDGINIPVGGEWFYSPWFEFYAPMLQFPGWAYHYEHGYVSVSEQDGKIYIFEEKTNTWYYTTPELYPVMYAVNQGQWVYYGGFYNGTDRVFYKYADGKWVGGY